MVLGVPFQFSNQFDSKLIILTEEEIAGIRASEMFKYAERRNSDPALPDTLQFMKRFSHHSNSSSSLFSNSPSRSNRSHSDDPSPYTHTSPLKYEEDTLLQHQNEQQQQHQQQQLESQQRNSSSLSSSDALSPSPSSKTTQSNIQHYHDNDPSHQSLLTVDLHDTDHHEL